MRPLDDILDDLAAGRATSRELVEAALDRIGAPGGEGARTFLRVDAEGARAAADASDARRRRGEPAGALEGLPVSVKDLFDVAGEVTRAGSVARSEAPPAAADAAAVARLKAAGAVVVGRTNMTEFAFSGVGLNPHYGTPRNPWGRDDPALPGGRIPGGSSSGAAVSVGDGMAAAALGTDTGGSVRIPAALCGLTGFKPTQARVPRDGVFPLSTTLDTVGPLAPTVSCCARLDAVLAGIEPARPEPVPAARLRLGVPQSYVLDDMDDQVAGAFERALGVLVRAGAEVVEIPLVELLELPDINAHGGFAAAEAYAIHRESMRARGDLYDPRVRVRIERGAAQSAADYIDLVHRRADLRRRVDGLAGGFDALVMPTVPTVAPPMADLADDEGYHRINARMLRNPSVANFLDRPAATLPCHAENAAPVGLMLVGETGGDGRLFGVLAGVEQALAVVRR